MNTTAALLSLTFLLLLSPTTPAQVDVRVDDLAGVTSDTFEVAVSVEDVTGLGILSYDILLDYDTLAVEWTGATSVGSLTESWGNLIWSPATKQLGDFHASTPLADPGALVWLRFAPKNGFTGTTSICLAIVLFNGGGVPANITGCGEAEITNDPLVGVRLPDGARSTWTDIKSVFR